MKTLKTVKPIPEKVFKPLSGKYLDVHVNSIAIHCSRMEITSLNYGMFYDNDKFIGCTIKKIDSIEYGIFPDMITLILE